MIYGYIRVSTDKQTTENQRFEILKFADEKKLSIDRWIEETISSTKKLSDRKLGTLIARMHEDDILIVSELSRLGRSLLEVMSILHTLMEREVKVFTTKERYELGNNISSKVLAFAFSLSAEIERSMISSRTKEALARKKSEGKRLGRPRGKLSATTKLTGKDDLIREYLEKKIPQSVIARLLNVHRLTVRNYIRTRKLQKPPSSAMQGPAPSGSAATPMRRSPAMIRPRGVEEKSETGGKQTVDQPAETEKKP